eukprot:1149744-Pelagomonas_calceolata.AAC.11
MTSIPTGGLMCLMTVGRERLASRQAVSETCREHLHDMCYAKHLKSIRNVLGISSSWPKQLVPLLMRKNRFICAACKVQHQMCIHNTS